MSTKNNTVLVVDDERSNLEVLINILSPEYTVYMTKHGSSAIEMANKYMPDLILLDIIMPDMNGYDVLSALKASYKTRHIPVIFISGLDSVEDEEKGLDLEASDFIHKPFSTKVVMSRVRNQLQIVNQIRELEKLKEDLELAVKTAESANQAKSAFLAKISHEMRTPLNAILGISEIQTQNMSLSKDMREAFFRIFNSGDLLLGIINDILDMSKIEAGKMDLNPTRYDVASLIYDTAFFNMIKYEHKPVEFLLYVDENVPSTMIGDELRIKQILNNLLSNAFKYTDEGRVELSFSVQHVQDRSVNESGDKSTDRIEGSGDTIMFVIRVQDTGQGMTTEQVNKLFEDYSRFNLEANRTTEGIGLGMSIMRNLINMMDGEIMVESEPGKGSRFTVRLKQGKVPAPLLGKEGAQRLQQFQFNYRMKTKIAPIEYKQMPYGKVLVVDNLEINLYVAEEMLLPYGLQIDKAISGKEALEKIKHNQYHIVFMDHMMPIMDGVETTKEIRKLGPEYEELPIIALTANAVSGVREMFLANGFNDFISKPIQLQVLDDVLKTWMPDGEAASGNS